MAVASDLPQIENQRQFEHRAQLVPVRRHGSPDRPARAAQQQRHRQLQADSARTCVTRSSRSRTSASGTTPASTSGASAARFVADVTGGATRGRLDDRRAVRQERAGPAGQPDDPREAPRGGAGVPAHPPLEQDEDPTEYLNSIYFGNGAYGIESAARVYFGRQLGYNAETPAASDRAGAARARRSKPPARRAPHSCAPTRRRCWPGWSPTRRRSTRSTTRPARPDAPQPGPADMLAQRDITRAAVRVRDQRSRCRPPPTSSSRRSRPAAPYFTSWVRPQILEGGRTVHSAYYGGLKIQTTIDLRDAAGGRAGDHRGAPERARTSRPRRWSRSTTRPARSGRWSAGRWSTATRTTSSYPFNLATDGRAPARLIVQAVHARRRAAARLHARLGLRLQAAEPGRPQQRRQGELPRPQLRQRVPRADHRRGGDRALRQHRVHPARPVARRRHQADQLAWPSDGHPHAGLDQLRDDHRRAKVGVSALDMAHAYETFADRRQPRL